MAIARSAIMDQVNALGKLTDEELKETIQRRFPGIKLSGGTREEILLILIKDAVDANLKTYPF